MGFSERNTWDIGEFAVIFFVLLVLLVATSDNLHEFFFFGRSNLRRLKSTNN